VAQSINDELISPQMISHASLVTGETSARWSCVLLLSVVNVRPKPMTRNLALLVGSMGSAFNFATVIFGREGLIFKSIISLASVIESKKGCTMVSVTETRVP
jgi:hypothetical protein